MLWGMDLDAFLSSTFSLDGLFGHASYMLLIASMLMTRMSWLRLLAIASGLLSIVYSLMIRDFVSASWEDLFVAVNVGQLGIQAWRNRLSRFDANERMFRERVVPGLEAAQVRRVLKAGVWQQCAAGQELITQGQLVSHLLFIADGQAVVRVEGVEIAVCGPGELLGEMSVLTDLPATGSVVSATAMHYLALERHALRGLMASEADIEQAIDACYRKDVRRKLEAANQALAAAGVGPTIEGR